MAIASTYSPSLCVAYAAYLALAALLVAAAVHDARTRTVRDGLLIAGCVVWAVSLCAIAFLPCTAGAATGDGSSDAAFLPNVVGQPLPLVRSAEGEVSAAVLDGLAGAVCLCALMLVCGCALGRVRNGPPVGGGDVKLMTVVGLYLGVLPGMLSLMAACALALCWEGARLAFVRMIYGRMLRGRIRATPSTVALNTFSQIEPDGTFPFVPFAAAAVITVVLMCAA